MASHAILVSAPHNVNVTPPPARGGRGLSCCSRIRSPFSDDCSGSSDDDHCCHGAGGISEVQCGRGASSDVQVSHTHKPHPQATPITCLLCMAVRSVTRCLYRWLRGGSGAAARLEWCGGHQHGQPAPVSSAHTQPHTITAQAHTITCTGTHNHMHRHTQSCLTI